MAGRHSPPPPTPDELDNVGSCLRQDCRMEERPEVDIDPATTIGELRTSSRVTVARLLRLLVAGVFRGVVASDQWG